MTLDPQVVRRPARYLVAGSIAAAALLTGAWVLSRQSADAADAALTLAVSQTPITYADDKAEKPLLPGTGALKGTILFNGEVPTLKLKVMKGDGSVKDPAVCAAQDIPDDTLVIDPKTKGIANIFVYLDKAPAGYKHTPPTDEVVFDQHGCRFTPHVLFIQVGQPLLIKSGDAIAHNTHATPIRSEEFNVAIGANDRKGVKKGYNKAERNPVPIKCDLHNWMTAHHLVKDHPFGDNTDEKGEFEIRNLPAGKHEFVVWQERSGYLNKKFEVTIEAGKVAKGDMKFDAKKFGL